MARKARKGRKARRSPKQKAATRKLVARNRKRFGGKRRRPTKARKARRTTKRKAYGRRRSNWIKRRNPGVLSGLTTKSYAKGLTGLPKALPKLLKGKGMIKNIAYAGGGIVAGMVGGSFLQRWTLPLIEKIPMVGGNLSGGITQRILGAGFSYTAAWAIGHVALKKEADRTAFIVGGATGAIIEAIFPGRLGAQMARLPLIGPYIGYSSPVMGLAAYYGSNELAAYVEAPAYQGVGDMGAYVEAPAYQGVGHLGAYVEAPAYQGVGAVGEYVEAPGYQAMSSAGDSVLSGLGVEMDYSRNDLAGIGSNMASFLDDPVL